MVLDNEITWPESDTSGGQSPPKIEKYLRSEISRQQVTLIGELDLVQPTNYAGINWSLLDLANYLISKPIIKNTLTNTDTWSNGIWPYPGTIAIWSVGHAQTAEDGKGLWELLDGYATSQKSRMAELFYQAISIMGLETFQDQLEDAQKYVQLARIHAMIPDFALERYSEIINRAVKFNRPRVQVLNEITKDVSISKSVQRLFLGNPSIGLDLIERSFNYVAYGYRLDLPDRIKDKLLLGINFRKTSRKSQSFPKVMFVEWERKVELRDTLGWKIENELGNEVNEINIGAEKVYVSNATSDKIAIFDVSAGYVIFDLDGNLCDERYLPSNGGFLLWSNKVEIATKIPHLDPGFITGLGWEDWQYSYFQDLSSLEIKSSSGVTRSLVRRKSLSVKLLAINHLVDQNRNRVFSEYPILEEKQFVKITDNLTDQQWSIDGEIGPIIRSSGGNIDLTLSAGLGQSQTCKGLVIPGIQVRGLETALILKEKRMISLKFPNEWKVIFPIQFQGQSQIELEVTGDPESDVHMIKVLDPSNSVHFLGVEIPILSWSIEYKDRENEMVATELGHKLEDRMNVQALILHEVDEYVPILRVGEVSVLGRRRGRDVRYDLRFLQDDHKNEQTNISITWNYETLQLISFRKVESRQKLIIKDFKDLLDASLKAEVITLESWNKYQSTKVAESKLLKARTRYLRRRQV